MIQPQELRIGNYVEYKDKMLKVLAIDSEAEFPEMGYKGLVRLPDVDPNGLVFGSSGRWCIFINPIPITPEILERCDGFFVDDMNYNENKENYCICVYEGTYLHINSKNGVTKIGSYEHSADVGIGTIDTTFYIQDTKHLHQLQNLYHSLTGNELTLKPPSDEPTNRV
jgi:hypothetical protein